MQYKELIDDDGIKLVKKLCLRKYGDPAWSEYITINKVLTEFIGLGYNVYGNCEHIIHNYAQRILDYMQTVHRGEIYRGEDPLLESQENRNWDKGRRKGKYKPIPEDEVVKLTLEGKLIGELAKVYKRNRRTITRVLVKHGITELDRTCIGIHCHKEFKVSIHNANKTIQHYCSEACADYHYRLRMREQRKAIEGQSIITTKYKEGIYVSV